MKRMQLLSKLRKVTIHLSNSIMLIIVTMIGRKRKSINKLPRSLFLLMKKFQKYNPSSINKPIMKLKMLLLWSFITKNLMKLNIGCIKMGMKKLEEYSRKDLEKNIQMTQSFESRHQKITLTKNIITIIIIIITKVLQNNIRLQKTP